MVHRRKHSLKKNKTKKNCKFLHTEMHTEMHTAKRVFTGVQHCCLWFVYCLFTSIYCINCQLDFEVKCITLDLPFPSWISYLFIFNHMVLVQLYIHDLQLYRWLHR